MIPFEMITMAGGALMGGVFKFIENGQKAKQKQQEMMFAAMQAKTNQANAESERATKAADAAAARVGNDPFAKMTRRMFVLSMIALGAWAMVGGLTGLDVVVPVSTTVGGSYLFGIIDTTKDIVQYQRFDNAIVHFEWLKTSILAAGAFYLGKS
jgi:hypothetical protein